jgi:hypothetical protein
MFKKLLAEDVLTVIKRIGPCQPSDIKKHIEGSDTMMIGALISSLIGKGDVLVTKTKKGGSPFYYTQEQTPQLVKVAQYLNEKDLRAYKMLQESKVLRDYDLTPLTRVCLRNIPDFAKKIEALVDNTPEIFWRYFLVPEQETPPMIKKILGIDEVPQTQEIPHEEHEEQKVPEKQSTLTQEQQEIQEEEY